MTIYSCDRSYHDYTLIDLRRAELEEQLELAEAQLQELNDFEENMLGGNQVLIKEALDLLVPYFKEARQATGGEWSEHDDQNIFEALQLLANC